MILSLRDRWGDQIGNYTHSEPGNTTTLYRGATAGDILRVCGNPTAGWTLESGGQCPDGSGSGLISSLRAQGPGDGEYYAGDEYEPFFDDSGIVSGVSGGGDLDDDEGRHDEIGLGASTQIPGFPDVVATMFDPVYNSAGNSGFNSGGARWLNNQTGLVERSYTLYDASMTGGSPPGPGNTLGKANGLGDIVEFCDLPPLEVGNRVWLDTNRDGTQDADEQSIGGVTVSLWEDADNDGQPDPGGFVVSGITSGAAGLNAPTDNAGQYLFVENGQSNGIAGTAELPASYNDGSGEWKYGTNYVIRLDRREDYEDTVLLEPYVITGQGLADVQNDSNGVDTTGTAANPVPPGFTSLDGVQFAQTAFNVGLPGEHNHTYDFGFNAPSSETDTPTPTATATLTDTPIPTDTPPPDTTDMPDGTPSTPGPTPDVRDRPPAEQTRIALNGGTLPPGLESVERLPETGEPRSRTGIYAALLAAGGLSVLMGAAGWLRRRR